ncbi:hypothetical protein DPX16_13809 [Anabarilius grahami]|uniref:Uncharacterized protein n=1 Tax=Anabarilius grahami TaxID=495550 RepID=A0A3N0XS25_ANAGA|nr:hypothetical protein DPX16_13809 [Anabarilius grahami]
MFPLLSSHKPCCSAVLDTCTRVKTLPRKHVPSRPGLSSPTQNSSPQFAYPFPCLNTCSGGMKGECGIGRELPVFAHVTKRAEVNERLGKIKRRRAEACRRHGEINAYVNVLPCSGKNPGAGASSLLDKRCPGLGLQALVSWRVAPLHEVQLFFRHASGPVKISLMGRDRHLWALHPQDLWMSDSYSVPKSLT